MFRHLFFFFKLTKNLINDDKIRSNSFDSGQCKKMNISNEIGDIFVTVMNVQLYMTQLMFFHIFSTQSHAYTYTSIVKFQLMTNCLFIYLFIGTIASNRLN